MKRKGWIAVFLTLAMIITMATPVSAKESSKKADSSKNKYSWEQMKEKPSKADKQNSDKYKDSADQSAAGEEATVEEETTSAEEETPVYLDGNLTGSDDSYSVTLTFNSDAQIPEGSAVSVKELSENDDAYQEAKEEVQPEDDQFTALDISIVDAEGNEIEPASAVQVEIEVSELPEGVNEDTEITVSHINESTGAPVVETVADTLDETEGTVEVKEDAAVVNFTVDSFSTFTIRYASETVENDEAVTYDTEENTTETSVKVPSNEIELQDVSDTEDVTVSVEGVEGITELAITPGALDASNESLAIEDYDFIRAQIGSGDDYTTITGLYKIEDSDDYYATIEGNETTGMRISDTTDVTLVYETHRDTYNVTYVIRVDGQTVTENTDSIVAVTGASTVRSGSDLEFAAVVQDGYTLSGTPSVTSGTISAGDNNTYTVTGINANTTITLDLEEVNEYAISFAGSNTILIYNGEHHSDSNGHGSEWNDNYTPEETITFTLRGKNEWSSEYKILNQLSITIDGVAAAAEIPDSVGESVDTTIAKGYVVTVTKTSAGRYPEYTVVITNPVDGGKVRGDIHIQTNYKDYNSSEVWAKQLDGVEPLAYSYGNTTIDEDNRGDQNSRLQPEVYTYYARQNHRDIDSTYYVKLTGEYNPEDLYLTVLSYGVESQGDDAELEYTIIDGQQVSTLSETTFGDYNYQFVIPADESGYYLSTSRNGDPYTGTVYSRYGFWGNYTYYEVENPTYDNNYYYRSGNNSYSQLYWVPGESATYTDIRIYIQYRPQTDAEYTITYDTDGGSNVAANSGTYHVGDSAVLTETIPTKDGYVFDGWYLERDPETLYDSGKLFTITEDNIAYANSDHEFVFIAKWTSVSEATYAPFSVQVFFQTEDEEGNLTYPETAEIITSERGRVGSTAYIIPSALQNVLDAQKPGWSDDYEYDFQQTDDTISPAGTTVLTIYYKLKVFQVYHTGVAGGNIETIRMSSLKDGTYDLTQNLTANTLYGGYYLGYDPDEEGAAYNGTNATWSDPQTENGTAMHPEAGETYYVKEVPNKYLHPATYIVYDTIDNNQIVQLYLITATDDQNYSYAGFDVTLNGITVGDNENFDNVVVNSLSDQVTVKKDGQNHQTLNAKTVFSDLDSGYLAISANKPEYIVRNANYIEKPYWVTCDGVKVTGNQNLKVYLRNTTYKEGWKLPGITKTAQTAVPTVTYVGTEK